MKQIGLVILGVAALMVSACAGSEASDSMFGGGDTTGGGSGGAGGAGGAGGSGGSTSTTTSKTTSSTSTSKTTSTSTTTSTTTWTTTSTSTTSATETWSNTGTTTGSLPDCDPMDFMCMFECISGATVCAASNCNCSGGGLPFP